MDIAQIILSLTPDDISDLAYITDRTGGGREFARAHELNDGGVKLQALGLVEVRERAVYGVAGSERLGTSDLGLDVMFELAKVAA